MLATLPGLSVEDAATRLGISKEAVRKRLDRGTLQGVKHGRRWIVYLLETDLPPDAHRMPADTARDTAQDAGADDVAHDNTMPRDTSPDAMPDTALMTHLLEEVTYLRSELADRTEEIRRRDHIIAGLVEQLRALPASTAQDTPAQAPVSEIQAPDSVDWREVAPGGLLGRLWRLIGRS